jgi:hypothetical protein
MLSLPVTVSGKTAQGQFSEDTQTVVISVYGALVGLKAKVIKGQTIRIKSVTFPDEQECQVIWIGPTAAGKTQCGLEFTKPAPKFWGVSFPPPEWSPSAAGTTAGAKKK